MKKAHKVCSDKPDWGSSEDQGADPFGNPDVIQDLINRFTLPEEVDCLADFD